MTKSGRSHVSYMVLDSPDTADLLFSSEPRRFRAKSILVKCREWP